MFKPVLISVLSFSSLSAFAGFEFNEILTELKAEAQYEVICSSAADAKHPVILAIDLEARAKEDKTSPKLNENPVQIFHFGKEGFAFAKGMKVAQRSVLQQAKEDYETLTTHTLLAVGDGDENPVNYQWVVLDSQLDEGKLKHRALVSGSAISAEKEENIPALDCSVMKLK